MAHMHNLGDLRYAVAHCAAPRSTTDAIVDNMDPMGKDQGPRLKRLPRAFRTVASGLAGLMLLSTCAQPPAGYYDSAEGLSGQALRIALHNIIDDHTALSYDQLWGAFQSTDATSANKVWDIYSDVPGSTPPYVYTFGSDQCGQYNGEGDCFNREHSFPQSWFNSASPMKSDLFHIYPTDGWVNNKRGNLPYGNVGSADYTSLNGSKTGLSVDPGYNSTVFEPIDAYKGDLARTYFYMMTRYLGETAGWSSPMMSGGDLAPWCRSVLLAWNDQDPVSPKETARNNAIFALQHNRNPYIDHPEWAHSIWDANTSIAGIDLPTATMVADGAVLHIAHFGGSTVPLRIIDLAGRPVWSGTIHGPSEDITLNAAKGLYIASFSWPSGPRSVTFSW